MSEWVEGRIQTVTHWTETLFSIRVEAALPAYRAGQFTRLALWLPGEEGAPERVAHAYSFVNPRAADYHEFYIVLIPGGRLTPALHRLQPGDSLWLAAQASGFLTAEELPDGDTLWLLSTGTAIGPFLSLLAEGALQPRYARVVLAHGVRFGRELNYQTLIRALQQATPDWLTYVPFVSREPWAEGLSGRIPLALADGRLERVVGAALTPASTVALCGNPQMVRDTLTLLQARGLHKHLRRAPGQICSENYW